MNTPEKKCKFCRFYFLNMPDDDGHLIVERNPDWNLTFKKGQKLCLLKKAFFYPEDLCGNFLRYANN
jgi:hypothetical protein